MSEEVDPGMPMPTVEDPNGAQSAGALLKQAREDAGIHISALAVALKVPVRKIEALEAGELATLSEPVFVRALASSVCRHLKMDSAQVLALLPLAANVPFSQPPELNTPFRIPGEGANRSVASRLANFPTRVVLALLVGALALAIWPTRVLHPVGEASTVILAPGAIGTAVPGDGGTSSPISVDAGTSPAPLAPSSGVTEAGRPDQKEDRPTAIGPAQATSAAAPAPTRPGGAAVAGAGSDGEAAIVRFKAKNESWVSVIDGKGNPVLRRNLQAGENVSVAGVFPLKIVVGRIDATEVLVRGKPFDMGAVSKDNIARFEVTE
jgi:cytoskeleton protein RodZ